MKPTFLTILLLVVPVMAGAQTSHPEVEPQDEQEHQAHEMQDPGGLYGEYESNREGSGTSWQPASSPMEALHFKAGEWYFMMHGFATGVYNSDPNPRGDQGGFSTNMFMLKTFRPTLEGTFGVRFMMSLEPTLGKTGYPLLLQTGETADGVNPLFDRQHPHDLFMEIALTYTLPVTDSSNLFLYFAPVGEPAIGPSVFMSRFSAQANPLAPVAHHWLDATHITYGVLTFGFVASDKVKLEGSFFRGLEPDENRWGLEAPGFDSYSGRFTVNPRENWSLQASFASLKEPEILHPGVDMNRLTASATYNRPIERGNWQTTVAWGRNHRKHTVLTIDPSTLQAAAAPSGDLENLGSSRLQIFPTPYNHFIVPVDPGVDGPIEIVIPTVVQNAFLAESALRFQSQHNVFGRLELSEKDELFPANDPRAATIYNVTKLNAGYLYDLPFRGHIGLGLGFTASVHFLPQDLGEVYGTTTPTSYMVYARFHLK